MIRRIPSSIFRRASAKVTVVSKVGKEATITLLAPQDFVGEEALAAVPGLRLASATCYYRLHRAQDRPRRDGPRDA